MAIFSKRLGEVSAEPVRAAAELADYVRYMAERLEFEMEALDRRLRELEDT